MRKIAAVLVDVLAGTIVACGGSGTPPAEAPRKLRFAVIPKALDLPVFDYARIGAERAAKELGVEVIWRGPETGDQLKQKEILESFITQRVDGIAISCLNGDFLADTINKAMDAGIPVVTWDADAPTSKRIAFYGVDDKAGGRIMGEEAVKLLNGKGTVALMTSVGATNLQRRLDGVLEVLAKHPGIKVIETFDVKEDTVKAAELIATGMNRYPDLGAWISVGGWPVFTRNALTPVPKTHARDLVRHDPTRSGAAQGRQGADPHRPEVLRLGRGAGEDAGRNQSREGCRLPRSSTRASTSSGPTTSMPTSPRSRNCKRGSRRRVRLKPDTTTVLTTVQP